MFISNCGLQERVTSKHTHTQTSFTSSEMAHQTRLCIGPCDIYDIVKPVVARRRRRCCSSNFSRLESITTELCVGGFGRLWTREISSVHKLRALIRLSCLFQHTRGVTNTRAGWVSRASTCIQCDSPAQRAKTSKTHIIHTYPAQWMHYPIHVCAKCVAHYDVNVPSRMPKYDGDYVRIVRHHIYHLFRPCAAYTRAVPMRKTCVFEYGELRL